MSSFEAEPGNTGLSSALRCSLHGPAVADVQRLPGQRIRLEGGEKERRFGNFLSRGEFTVDSVLEHDLLDDRLLGFSELPRLFGNLFVHERRSHEAGAN